MVDESSRQPTATDRRNKGFLDCAAYYDAAESILTANRELDARGVTKDTQGALERSRSHFTRGRDKMNKLELRYTAATQITSTAIAAARKLRETFPTKYNEVAREHGAETL